ncbi:MAG: DUF2914 domain-containing protein [Deltaproteobacteria bacterium]|nr:DUF2914 domain-containing protein [Deltaproteobacteria bacterium]
MKKLFLLSWVTAIIAVGIAFPVSAQDQPGFTIERLLMATGIENREPVGVAATFPADTPKVYCFLEAGNVTTDTTVTFVWIHDGTEILKTSLPLKAGFRWRTRADKNLYGLTGDWKVEIRDAAGNTVKDIEFQVR